MAKHIRGEEVVFSVQDPLVILKFLGLGTASKNKLKGALPVWSGANLEDPTCTPLQSQFEVWENPEISTTRCTAMNSLDGLLRLSDLLLSQHLVPPHVIQLITT